MRTLDFVPKCTEGLHGMGLNNATIKQTFIWLKQPFLLNGIELYI